MREASIGTRPAGRDIPRTGDGAGPRRTVADPRVDICRRMFDRLLGPAETRDFAVRYWTGLSEGPSDPVCTLVLRWPGALRRMLLPPTERSLGEAYVFDHCDVEGDLEAAVRVLAPALHDVWSPRRLAELAVMLRRLPARRNTRDAPPGEAMGRAGPTRRGRLHSRNRDARSVRFHYDLGNDFYALWLDPYMQYSSGYFPRGDESLEEGQKCKLDLLCRKLQLEPGQRLLDIGCGWGGLIRFAAERFGVRATGITLSEPQAEFGRRRLAEEGLADRCEIRVMDYRDLPDPERFDAIVSVGMVEHVGRGKLPEFFGAAFRHLVPGGLFLDQGIVTLDDTRPWLRRLRERVLDRWTSFIESHVFPDGELVTTGERLAPAEAVGFETRDVTSLREHYATTLRHWVGRLQAAREEAVALVGRPTYRVWELYMAGSAYGFASGRIGVVHEVYRRPT